MTVQDVLNKHKHCNYWMIINHLGECILETDNLENIDKDILNKEVEEYHNFLRYVHQKIMKEKILLLLN